jgi:hypothetical protein
MSVSRAFVPCAYRLACAEHYQVYLVEAMRGWAIYSLLQEYLSYIKVIKSVNDTL